MGLLGAKLARFLIEQNHCLALAIGTLLTKPERYHHLVGCLIYLSFTCYDLPFVVHILAQSMQVLRQEHWDDVVRSVCNLRSFPGQGILLCSICDLSLSSWCNSNWGSCPLARCSLSGWLVFFGNSPISWKTKKQQMVSHSSTELKYRSMTFIKSKLT